MTPEQTEVVAKLKEIEEQARLLMEEMSHLPSLARSRILHIKGLAEHLRRMIGEGRLAVVKNIGERK